MTTLTLVHNREQDKETLDGLEALQSLFIDCIEGLSVDSDLTVIITVPNQGQRTFRRETAKEISEERSKCCTLFLFSLCGTDVGLELEFYSDTSTVTGMKCTIVDDASESIFQDSVSYLGQHLSTEKSPESKAKIIILQQMSIKRLF